MRLGHVDRPEPRSGIDAKFSIQYCLARTLLQGQLRIEDFEGDAFRDPAVRAVMLRVHSAMHPVTVPGAPREAYGGAEIRVMTKDGQVHSSRVEQPLGRVPGQPLPREMLESKFSDCALRILPPARAAELLDAVREIDAVDDLREIAAIMHPAPGGRRKSKQAALGAV
jgi:2-methylcitrate dehydratase PrpD